MALNAWQGDVIPVSNVWRKCFIELGWKSKGTISLRFTSLVGLTFAGGTR